MTLYDLLETNGHVTMLDIDLRGDKSSEHQLVQRYRIGLHAELFASEHEGKATANHTVDYVILIKKPLHAQQDGAGSNMFGFVKKSVPKELGELTVTYWTSHSDHFCPDVRRDAIKLHVHVFSGIETVDKLNARMQAECAERAKSADELKIDFKGAVNG